MVGIVITSSREDDILPLPPLFVGLYFSLRGVFVCFIVIATPSVPLQLLHMGDSSGISIRVGIRGRMSSLLAWWLCNCT